MNKLQEIHDFARMKMDSYGLEDWEIRFSKRMKQALGVCNYRKREIALSIDNMLSLSEKEWKDTVLHEIAHALTPGDKHGAKWKQACRAIGANPERLYKGKNTADNYKWAIVKGRKILTGYHRRPNHSTIKALREGRVSFVYKGKSWRGIMDVISYEQAKREGYETL